MSEHPQGRGVGCQETKATGEVYRLLKLYTWDTWKSWG